TKVFVDALEPERRKWLKDTPFHKLLDMDRNIQNNGLIRKFASIFYTKDHSIELEGERHVITPQDVTKFLGIEDGDDEEVIKMPRRGEQTKVLPKLIKVFVRKGHKGICIDYVKKRLRDSWDEDTVKRAFILLALQYIIYPLSDRAYLHESCLHLVEDVSALNKKRWATFAITSLVNGIEKYKNYKGNTQIFIGGCALLLQLYATKGSITTPLECDKRGKMTRDKDCSGSSSSSKTIKSSHLEAMDTTRKIYENVMDEVRKCKNKMKVHKSQRDVMEDNYQNIFSILESQRDTTITTFQKSLDEHVAAVARDTRVDPQNVI
nr:aminotransferase-like mobile domain-containing protein [Tanacetum cinerariifolium]